MLEARVFSDLLARLSEFNEPVLWVNPPAHWLPPSGDPVMSTHWGQCCTLRNQGGQVMFGPDEWPQDKTYPRICVLTHPKSRHELLWWLEQLAARLPDGATVLCIGHKKSGIEGGFRQLKKLGAAVSKVDTARHCQVWSLERLAELAVHTTAHPWSFMWGGQTIQVSALPGVFAEGRLDAGSELLLDTLSTAPLPAGRVMDFGCGAGVLTAVLAGQTGLEVEAVDVQWQALACTRTTLALNGLSANVYPSDGLSEVGGGLNAIVSNPPFHEHVRQTTEVTEKFLAECAQHLVPGGRLRIVANAFLPYMPIMERYVGPCTQLARTPAYIVYEARREH